MAECAYHMEALRRQRVIDRKKVAVQNLLGGNKEADDEIGDGKTNPKNTILYSDPGHYEVNRSIYNWIGTERCRRQYDHSRNGPLLDSSWLSLRQELNSIGRGTPINAGEGRSLKFNDLLRVRVVTPKK